VANQRPALDSRRSCDLRDALGAQRNFAQLTRRESRCLHGACRLRLPTALCPARSTVDVSDQDLFLIGTRSSEAAVSFAIAVAVRFEPPARRDQSQSKF